MATLSNDGSRIAIAGLNLAPGSTPATAACEAVVGTVDAFGNVVVTTSMGTAATPYAGGKVYGATTDTGANFWLSGQPEGMTYVAAGSSSGNVATLDTNAQGWSSVAAAYGRCVLALSLHGGCMQESVAGPLPRGEGWSQSPM